MLRWGLAYVFAVVTVAMGIVAAVQTHSLREAQGELSAARAQLERLQKSRQGALGEVEASKRQMEEAVKGLDDERTARLELEQQLKSAAQNETKAAEARERALRSAGEAEAAARRERELREAAERALHKALETTAGDKAELARLENELARLKTAPKAPELDAAAPAGESAPSDKPVAAERVLPGVERAAAPRSVMDSPTTPEPRAVQAATEPPATTVAPAKAQPAQVQPQAVPKAPVPKVANKGPPSAPAAKKPPKPETGGGFSIFGN